MNKRQNGAIAIIIAVSLVALIAAAGIGIDTAFLMMTRGKLQNAADSAALACLLDSATCSETTDAKFGGYGYAVAITPPPSAAPNSLCPAAGQSSCDRAIASVSYKPFLMGIVGAGIVQAQAEAQAGRVGGGFGCLFALDGASAVNVGGSFTMQGYNCANNFASVNLTGNVCNPDDVNKKNCIVSDANQIYNDNYATQCTKNGASGCIPSATRGDSTLAAPPVTAPSVSGLSAGGCTGTGCSGSSAGTISCANNRSCDLSPGTYNGLSCGNGSTCTLKPNGTSNKFAFSGNMTMDRNATFKGDGVLIYLSGSGQTISLGSGPNAVVDLKAPQLGDCATASSSDQIVLYGENPGTLTMGGTGSASLKGNVYLPKYSMDFNGTTALKIYGSLVVNTYTQNGGGDVTNLVIDLRGQSPSPAVCGFEGGPGRVVLVK